MYGVIDCSVEVKAHDCISPAFNPVISPSDSSPGDFLLYLEPVFVRLFVVLEVQGTSCSNFLNEESRDRSTSDRASYTFSKTAQKSEMIDPSPKHFW